MKCCRPVLVPVNFTGKQHFMSVPCGKCIACRVNRSEELAGRITRELEMRYKNGDSAYFLTFTYSDENLPSDRSLSKKVVTLLMRRLKRAARVSSYFFCGEYGNVNERPHYHAILTTDEASEMKFYDICKSVWPYGFIYIKRAHNHSAKYISKYVVKADDRIYQGRQPCFIQSSLRYGTSDRVKQSYEVRKLYEADKSYIYRDALGRKHPYPRKSISAAFTPVEKENNLFFHSERSDEQLYQKYIKSRFQGTFEQFRVYYENSRNESLETNYWKKQYFKK